MQCFFPFQNKKKCEEVIYRYLMYQYVVNDMVIDS